MQSIVGVATEGTPPTSQINFYSVIPYSAFYRFPDQTGHLSQVERKISSKHTLAMPQRSPQVENFTRKPGRLWIVDHGGL